MHWLTIVSQRKYSVHVMGRQPAASDAGVECHDSSWVAWSLMSLCDASVTPWSALRVSSISSLTVLTACHPARLTRTLHDTAVEGSCLPQLVQQDHAEHSIEYPFDFSLWVSALTCKWPVELEESGNRSTCLPIEPHPFLRYTTSQLSSCQFNIESPFHREGNTFTIHMVSLNWLSDLALLNAPFQISIDSRSTGP